MTDEPDGNGVPGPGEVLPGVSSEQLRAAFAVFAQGLARAARVLRAQGALGALMLQTEKECMAALDSLDVDTLTEVAAKATRLSQLATTAAVKAKLRAAGAESGEGG